MTAYEPRVMRHPHARKGKITAIVGTDPVTGRPFRDSQGEPDMFPEVTVKDASTEAYYRSRGYLFDGEVPNPPAEYAEYPVMLVHSKHKEAVPDDYVVEKGEHNEIIRHKIPGNPEQFAPCSASNRAEELALEKKGYHRAGLDNPEAIRKAKASPYDPDQKTEEFPKMVDGQIEDPGAPTGGPVQYPMWVGDGVVNSRAEHEALLAKQGKPALAPLPQKKAAQAPAKPPKAAAKPDGELADGRKPLKETARQRRQREAAEQASPKPATKLRGSRTEATAGE